MKKAGKRLISLILCFVVLFSMAGGVSAEEKEAAARTNYLLRPADFEDQLGTWTPQSDALAFEKSNLIGLHENQSHDPTKARDAAAEVTVENTGTYNVWVHAKKNATSESVSANAWTFRVGVDDKTLEPVFGGAASSTGYVWQNGGTIELSEGTHTIRLIDSSANWARCDAVLITADLDMFPSNDYEQLLEQINSGGGSGDFDDNVDHIVDNREAEASFEGDWTSTADESAYQGEYMTASEGTFTWHMQIPDEARYEICWYGADFYNNQSIADKVRFTLSQDGETKGVWETTQRLVNGWHPLEQLELKQGEATLTLSASSGNTGRMAADAVRFEKILVEGESSQIIDNTDKDTQKSGEDSNWNEHNSGGSVGDSYYSCTGKGSDSTYFIWNLNPLEEGWWKVEAFIPESAETETLSSQVTYAVTHDGQQDTVIMDHTTASGWTELGTWYFAADGEESIMLMPGTGEEKWALVDAVKITYMGKMDPDADYEVVDNTDTEKTVIGGTWHDSAGAAAGWQGPSTYRPGFVGENYYSLRGGDDSTFTWKFSVAQTGYYRISVSIADGSTGGVSESVKYEIQTSTGVRNVSISHKQPAGYYSLGNFQLTAGDEPQPVLKLIGKESGTACMVDAAMIEFLGTEPVFETGEYSIDLEDPQQTIWGLGVEIQSDSIASGNGGLPEETNSAPHDLIQSERDRFYSEMLKGFRYVRMAGGLFYRGADEEGKHLQERWETQDEELAELVEKSGIEGFNFEFWSPTPYFKASGKYTISGAANNQEKMLRCFGPDFENDPIYHGDKERFLNDFADTLVEDFKRMRADGLPIVQFSLQNEPAITSVYGDYSHCYYTPQAYYETCKVVLPKLKEAFPDLFIHATSWEGQNAEESKMIKEDQELFPCVDGWSYHRVGYNSNDPLDSADYLNAGTEGLPVICTEFEYQPWNFSGQDEFRFVNTAQMIMNWMTFENSPTFYWLHALKPLGNEESLGYSLGFWRKPGDTGEYEVCDYVEEGHWDYNYQNWNAIRGFLKYMPWDSVRYTVKEDEVRKDQRIMAWKSPEGRLAFALTNRSSEFCFKVDTGLEDTTFHGYRLTADCEEEIDLGTKTGGEISTVLEPYTIEFWVQEEDDTMVMAEGVVMDQNELKLAVGNEAQLTADVLPENAANKNVRWTSDDSTIASVDENGIVTALKEGETKIIAMAISGSGQFKAECTVKVGGEEPSQPISKKTLEYFLNKAKGYVEDGTVSGLVESIQQMFTDAIAKGEEVLADESATREEVLDAVKDLMLSIHALDMKAADKTDLEMTLELAEMIDLSKYVEAGQAEYLAAKEAAEAVLSDGDAMQAETDEAWNKLVEAMNALRMKADKTVLEDLISKMENMDLTEYTEESAAVFRAALASAGSILADKTLSVDEQVKVDEAAAALQDAYDGLEPVSQSSGDTEKPADGTNGSDAGKTEEDSGQKDTKDSEQEEMQRTPKTGDAAWEKTVYAAALVLGMLTLAFVLEKRKRS